MRVSAINNFKTQTQTFDGIRKYTHTILPEDSKSFDKITLNIKDGQYMKTVKKDKARLTYLEGVGRLTQWFDGDKLVGTLKEFANGTYIGSRVFSDGTSIEYSTRGNHVHTVVKKNGKFLSHTTGYAYDEKGRPNIMTKKEIDGMIQMTSELVKNPEKLAKATEESLRTLSELFSDKK